MPEWLGSLASDNRHSYYEPFREARPLVSESQLFLDRWWSSWSLYFVTTPESAFRAPTSIRPLAVAGGRCSSDHANDPELGCSTVAVNRPGTPSGLSITSHVLPANPQKEEVDPTRLELVTSAMRGRLDSFPNVSRTCKIPANRRITVLTLFSAFQEIYPGCCTVAAQLSGLTSQPMHQFNMEERDRAKALGRLLVCLLRNPVPSVVV